MHKAKHHADDDILVWMKEEHRREDALKAMMRSYHQRLYWQVRKMVHIHEDADDVLQQVWVKVYEHMERFEGRSSLHSWLYRIAHNEAIGLLRKKKRVADHYDEELHQHMVDTIVADPYFDGDEATAMLHAATLQLTDKQRAVFNMRYFDELPYQDISDLLGTSVGGLKALYHHARKQVEHYIITQVKKSTL